MMHHFAPPRTSPPDDWIVDPKRGRNPTRPSPPPASLSRFSCSMKSRSEAPAHGDREKARQSPISFWTRRRSAEPPRAERSKNFIVARRHQRGRLSSAPLISATSWLRGSDLNRRRPLGYEPFLNQDWRQGATNNASSISVSQVGGFGSLWLSLGATSWVKSG